MSTEFPKDHPRKFRIVRHQRFDELCNPKGEACYTVEEYRRTLFFGIKMWKAATKLTRDYEGGIYRTIVTFNSEGDAAVFMMNLYAGKPRDMTLREIVQTMEI